MGWRTQSRNNKKIIRPTEESVTKASYFILEYKRLNDIVYEDKKSAQLNEEVILFCSHQHAAPRSTFSESLIPPTGTQDVRSTVPYHILSFPATPSGHPICVVHV